MGWKRFQDFVMKYVLLGELTFELNTYLWKTKEKLKDKSTLNQWDDLVEFSFKTITF